MKINQQIKRLSFSYLSKFTTNIVNKPLYTSYKFMFCNSNKKDSTDKKRSFGYKDVKVEEHQSMVNQIFNNVANKYDLMNDVMSVGVHRLWKTEFVNMIGHLRPNSAKDKEGKLIYSPMKIIDVAGGTGDISFKILNKANEYHKKYLDIFPVEIKVVDINVNMLEEGRKRAENEGVSDKLTFIECNAEKLDFIPDESVDLYTISFGIRNCTNRENVLKEAFRVLKRGGRFMCMEFSHVTIPGFNFIYDWYSENIIPELGGLVMNDKESYRYLVESIRRFPNQEDFKNEIIKGGFSFANYVNFSGGIVAVHSGIKI